MQIHINRFWGSFAGVTAISSFFLIILGAGTEVRSLSSRVFVNRTAAEWNDILKMDRKDPSVVSNNPSLHSSINPKKLQVEELSSSVVHSSFEDSSRNNDKLNENDSKNLAAEQLAEVGNGLTDTGQIVLLPLVETESSHAQLQTESLGVIVSSENLSDLLTMNSEKWTEEVNGTVTGVEHFEVKTEEGHDSSQGITGQGKVGPEKEEVTKEAEGLITTEEIIAKVPVKEANVVLPEETEASIAEPSGDNVAQPPDDIPSFSEWAQRQLEEAERNKVHNITVPVNTGAPLKLRSKNYASPDCGAKIVAANPEAVSPSSVLSQSRDEYLLNPCMNRIWLVVELCDSIQAKKIDIANFELFSSSPKELSVSVSDRFPTRDWRSVGQFTANDVRDIQSYNLHPHLFGKFVKLEIKSHYGSEHFCPVSLIRVYGTSEFEVLETEDEVHQQNDGDDEDEGSLGSEDSGSPPRNLYGIARDAVKSIVKAAEALVIRSEPATNLPQNSSDARSASTPSHLVICDNCSNILFSNVFNLLEHRPADVYSFVSLPFVKDALHTGLICASYGLDFGRRRPTTYPPRQDPGDYLSSMLPVHYVVALCNALAVIEKKVLVNTSHDLGNMSLCHVKTEFEGFIVHPKATCSVDSSSCHSSIPSPDRTPTYSTAPEQPLKEVVSTQINPSKPTNTSDDTSPVVQPTDTFPSDVPHIDATISPELPNDATPSVNATVVDQANVITSESDNEKASTEGVEEMESNVEAFEEDVTSEPLDILLSELKDMDQATTPAPTAAAMPPQKESVFVRLTNRIKALERNMSLSSQYLEELSRRYKRQVEEMSRTLNRTLANVEAETKRRDERELLSEAEMSTLRVQLVSLTAVVETLVIERDGWSNRVTLLGQHLLLIAIEVLVFVIVWYIWRLLSGDDTSESGKRKWSFSWRSKKVQLDERRRKSVNGVSGHQSPIMKRKRPSEVALNISGTYTDLLITESPMSAVEGVWSNPKVEQKRRRRKRKDAMSKSSSSAILLEHPSCQGSLSGSKPCGQGGASLAVRRSSLSELGTVSIPVNGVQRGWNTQEAPKRIQELPPELDSTYNVPNILKDRSNRSVISVPKYTTTKESLEKEINNRNPTLVRCNLSLQGDSFRRMSSPSFMKTAMSSRAGRCASEEPILQTDVKSKDWKWQGSSNSAPLLLPISHVNDVQRDVDERPDQVASQTTGRKKGNSLKKIVKRFF